MNEYLEKSKQRLLDEYKENTIKADWGIALNYAREAFQQTSQESQRLNKILMDHIDTLEGMIEMDKDEELRRIEDGEN